MIILGLCGGFDRADSFDYQFPWGSFHDSAAALWVDGHIVNAAEEERFNRIKHTNKIWSESINFCLKQNKISAQDIDYVAIYLSKQLFTQIMQRQAYLTTSPTSFETLANIFYQETGFLLPEEKFKYVPHHRAHAASTYFTSGFTDALVMTIDGQGEGISTLLLDGQQNTLDIILKYDEANSLGDLYTRSIWFLGYSTFNEYKVMGLAPYGNPQAFINYFNELYTLKPNGDFELHLQKIENFFDLITPPQQGEFLQCHKDFAAALQLTLETLVMHILSHHQAETQHQRLCLAGGVAQNSRMNGKIMQSGLFKDMFVQPASHDGGCAIGAALHVANTVLKPYTFPKISHVYWGYEPSTEKISHEISLWQDNISCERIDDITTTTAQLIANGSIIAWYQGKAEFGPRALGNRSILADPRFEKNKILINMKIKKRESYRPFAPAVLEEFADQFFELPTHKKTSPFMTFVFDVKPKHRPHLEAVTHVDGTARLQTVNRETNPIFWELINQFYQITQIPILLNTSFNNYAEPIVNSIADAITTFLTSNLDYLIINNYLIKKREALILDNYYLKIPEACELHKAICFKRDKGKQNRYWIECNYNPERLIEITEKMYQCLELATEGKNIAQLMKTFGENDDSVNEINIEINKLWESRYLRVFPST